jgi:hypothetical protein
MLEVKRLTTAGLTIPAMSRPSLFRKFANSLLSPFQKQAVPLAEDPEDRDLSEVSAYHDSFPPSPLGVDDRTWADLDLDGVLAQIDRGATILGRQVLYHQLRVYESDEVLAQRAREQRFFSEDAAFAARTRAELRKLDGRDAKWLAYLILQPLPPKPSSSWALLPLSVTLFLCVVGIPFFHPFLLLALAFGAINAGIHLRFRERIEPFFLGFLQISRMLSVGALLSGLPGGEALPQKNYLRRSQGAAARLKKQLGWLVIDRGRIPEPVNSLMEYLNVFLLVDLIVFVRSIERLRNNRAFLLEYFEAIGSWDASMAVANYWGSLEVKTRPSFTADREITVEDIRHPLVEDAVGASFSLRNRSAVIAGPNMAGKTTFIRTVAINLILARTLNLSLGKSAIFPRAVVHSSIKREDSLSEGQSYFFAELDQILGFTSLSEDSVPRLFLIDEPFRGTNTVERIAISSSVLRYLAKHHLVLASTHDAELQQLLADSFEMFHFSDKVTDGKYGFDYLIWPGPAKSRNAIKLLEIRGYPLAVVAEAARVAAELAAKTPP